jgi:hypothetical protein
MLLDDLASDVLRAFGDLDGDPARESLRMDAAVSLAAVEALAGARPDLAQAVLEQPAAPALLHELAAGLLAVAQVTVAAANGMQVLVALRLDDGWWSTALVDDDVLLDPVGEDELVSWLAAALTSALTAGASS